MSESSTPPGPMVQLVEMKFQRVGRRNQRPRPKPSQKAKAASKRKTGTGKNVVPLVKRKALEEKRDR